MVKSVRAKFRVYDIEKNEDGTEGQVSLGAVTSGSEENKSFWKYTPSGSLQMYITNPEALNRFSIGQEYYLDFTPADS